VTLVGGFDIRSDVQDVQDNVHIGAAAPNCTRLRMRTFLCGGEKLTFNRSTWHYEVMFETSRPHCTHLVHNNIRDGIQIQVYTWFYAVMFVIAFETIHIAHHLLRERHSDTSLYDLMISKQWCPMDVESFTKKTDCRDITNHYRKYYRKLLRIRLSDILLTTTQKYCRVWFFSYYCWNILLPKYYCQ